VLAARLTTEYWRWAGPLLTLCLVVGGVSLWKARQAYQAHADWVAQWDR
jgi:hypothetical protein